MKKACLDTDNVFLDEFRPSNLNTSKAQNVLRCQRLCSIRDSSVYCRTASSIANMQPTSFVYKRRKISYHCNNKPFPDTTISISTTSFERSRSNHAYLHHHKLVDNHPPLDFTLLPCQTIISCPFSSEIPRPPRKWCMFCKNSKT